MVYGLSKYCLNEFMKATYDSSLRMVKCQQYTVSSKIIGFEEISLYKWSFVTVFKSSYWIYD